MKELTRYKIVLCLTLEGGWITIKLSSSASCKGVDSETCQDETGSEITSNDTFSKMPFDHFVKKIP
jgi:hypothetical protein